jgi:hypothetical protein
MQLPYGYFYLNLTLSQDVLSVLQLFLRVCMCVFVIVITQYFLRVCNFFPLCVTPPSHPCPFLSFAQDPLRPQRGKLSAPALLVISARMVSFPVLLAPPVRHLYNMHQYYWQYVHFPVHSCFDLFVDFQIRGPLELALEPHPALAM